MSIAELKQTADKLTTKESAWLSAYLAAKIRAQDPAWKTEMARRLKRMRAGHGLTETEHRLSSRRPSTQRPASATK